MENLELERSFALGAARSVLGGGRILISSILGEHASLIGRIVFSDGLWL